MTKIARAAIAGLTALVCQWTFAETWYVDNSVEMSGDGTTWQTAFKTIQEGIDAASDADTVIVAEGTYLESIGFKGKNITLTSTDPLDPNIVGQTVIDGNKSGPVVTFAGTENETCTLTGFTIRNGAASYGGGVSGGTADNRTKATIENNVVSANSAESSGGGLAFCDGHIRNNLISGNSAADDGGGAYECDGPIEGNEVEKNRAIGELYFGVVNDRWGVTGYNPGAGAGLAGCDGLIEGNTISENVAGGPPGWSRDDRPLGFGGGLAYCNGNIRNNVIVRNIAAGVIWWCIPDMPYVCQEEFFGEGAGLYGCNGTIEDNFIGENESRSVGGLADCNATIRNNTITRNWHQGLRNCDGMIEGNAISENHGPGVEGCDGTIKGNTISNNSGAGVASSDGTIEGNSISGNSDSGVARCDGLIEHNMIFGNWNSNWGGGVCFCQGTIRNNLIYRNSAPRGGGLYYCDGQIVNNTISENTGVEGGGLWRCRGEIVNCIIWANGGSSEVFNCALPKYSCIEGWMEGGEGNIALYPYFLDPDSADFHLKSWSPCIDAGDPASDFSNEPEPNGSRLDMGAYGNTPEAMPKSQDSDADGLPDDWEAFWFQGLQPDGSGDLDGDGILNVTEYRYGWNPTAVPTKLVENRMSLRRYESIAPALVESQQGDEIVVYPATYSENVNFFGKNVVLRSAAPSDPNIVAATIIEPRGSGVAVTFSGTEDETCVLAGFTVRRGGGAGICGGIEESRTHATIRNNVITKNGAGLAFCDGLVENNVISENTAYTGGGLYDCDGLIRNNIITANTATDGGGLASCDGVIEANTITRNAASGRGGGLYKCGGLLQNNTLWGNRAELGAGLYDCDGTIENNTVYSNSATETGGGLAFCNGVIRNCIIWRNLPFPQVYESAVPTYSCIEGWTAGGEGNIAGDPLFVDPDGPDDTPWTFDDNDYRLLPDSPCIDAGKNESWMWSAVDLDGNPRVARGFGSLTVDMGAYEYWFSEFGVLSVRKGVHGELELTWRSRPGDTYTVMSCFDLLSGDWKSRATIHAYGSAASWTDTDAAKATQKFYRIQIYQ